MSVRGGIDQNCAYMPDMQDWWGDGAPAPRQKRPSPRARNLPETLKPRAAVRRAQRRKAQAMSRLLMYMTLGVLAVCLFMQVNRYAQIAAQTKKISSLVTQIKTLQSDKTNLELRLSARENLKRLRDEAMYNLGMDYPAEGQVRVVALKDLSGRTQAQTAAISADSAR